MSACPDRYENILLDIYGELDSPQRSSLEGHLANCPGCREEHRKVLQLIERIKVGFAAPVLADPRARALSSSIRQALLREKAPRTSWGGFFSPSRLVPSLAAACLVIVLVGWFTLRTELYGPPQDRNAMQAQQISPTDMEVIKNLDLLEELDVLKILVNVVDGRETL